MRHFYYIFLVVVFGFTITTSCSSDDDVESTFLERYEGTVWQIAVDESYSDYLMFHNDESAPFEVWSSLNGGDCYENDIFKLDDFDTTITENSEEVLEITLISGDVWLFKVEENSMVWTWKTVDSGETIFTLEKQNSEVVDDLTMCTQ
ncbi:hypothetical protein E7Z59_00165 [Robertkochia marina]|uniref:Uncharacterized protein n=1 Tax=Robertkochia marina TaxID=1227945 RepID=A0A4S3M291_9FLAO|nr:hypothetical protein [Robertkochia marina]THD68779.1 hypothetical protein E7Z59_00165 [Robertkochia marina]TRZ43852.1 hypothetical protein D3A96_09815 [Robertkochia marina]